MILPTTFLKIIKEEKTNFEKLSAQDKLFKHTVKFHNRKNNYKTKVSVSAYLNVEITEDQQCLLNPTVIGTVPGFILKDEQGKGGKNIWHHCLDFVDGQVSAHCRLL